MRKEKMVPVLILVCLLSLSLLAGCGETAKKEVYPTKPINVIVAFAAGGNTDVGARILLPLVEKELGVPINVINKAGGGGWVGWAELLNTAPDGYTIGYINTPNLITGYLDPQFKRDKNLENFDLIANHVTDYGCISINPKDTRFKDINELIEYARKNELTATTTGVGSDDHIAMLKVNQKYGTKFVPVHTPGSAQQRAAVIGGHADVNFANVGDSNLAHKDGELKVLAVMAPKRSEFLPDVPTLAEVGYPGVNSWSARGLAAPKGLDPKIKDKLMAAFKKALTDPGHIKKMNDMGLQVDVLTGEEHMKFLKEEEKGCIELADLLGWKK